MEVPSNFKKKKKKKNLSITSSDQVSQEGVQAISACADFSWGILRLIYTYKLPLGNSQQSVKVLRGAFLSSIQFLAEIQGQHSAFTPPFFSLPNLMENILSAV